MAEQLDDLERRLSRLAGDLTWPATPDLRAQVRRAVLTPRPWFNSRWALAAVAVVTIVALLAAYAPARTAIADWVNLHLRINRTNTLPTPSAHTPGPLGQYLGLGSQTTLLGAQQGVKWTVLVPSTLGEPDAVYLQTNGPSGGEVSLVYASRPGIPVSGNTGVSVLVTEAQGRVNEQYFGKMLGSGTTIEDVSVGGHRGWWISGTPHDFFFIDSNGNIQSDALRLAGNTLVIDMNGTLVRIEGDMTKDQALAIAASLG